MNEELFQLEPLPLVLKPKREKIATSYDVAHVVKCVSVQEVPAVKMDQPERVHEYYQAQIASAASFDRDKEHLHVFALNTKYMLSAVNLVSMGSLNESLAQPREVFRPVIACAAYCFILVHNHPSGIPDPSEADRRLTARLKQCADILNVPLMDHVIIGDAGKDSERRPFFSFREAALL